MRQGWTKVLKIVTKSALAKMLFSLRKRPIVFLTLVNTMSRWSWNIYLESNTTRRSFWEFVWETSQLLKNNLGCETFCNFLLNKTSRTHPPLNCLIINFIQVLLNSFAEILILWTTEESDASSANSLTIKDLLSGKSFI